MIQYISFRWMGADLSIVFCNSLTALQRSVLLCLVSYNKLPTPLQYVACSFGGNLSSSSVTLMAMNLGVPGVNPSLCFMASLANFFLRFLIMDG